MKEIGWEVKHWSHMVDSRNSSSSSSSSSVGPVANATDVLQPSRFTVLTLSPPPVWTFPHLPPGTPMSTTM